MKNKVVIFGAGGTGRRIMNMIRNSCEILFMVDNDESKWDSMVDIPGGGYFN